MATIEELGIALKNADRAGDVQAATRLAAEIQRVRSQPDSSAQAEGRHLTYQEGLARLQQEEQDQRMKGPSGALGATLTGLVDGIPVAGPVLKGAAERGAAGLSSLIDGEPYADNLKQTQRLTKKAQEEHPYSATAGSVAGAIGGTLPMVMAAPAAFGGGSGNLFIRMLASGGSGAALGGADAAVRSGGDPDEVMRGMKWGGGLGVAGPAVGKVVGAGARSVIDWFGLRKLAAAAGTTPKTASRLAAAASRDGLDDAAIRARLAELGPEGMLADLGPNLGGYAGAIANMPGRGQQIVRSALDARRAGANTRLATSIDDTLGPARVPSTLDDAMASGQDFVSERYPEVFRNAAAVDTTRIANALESKAVNLRGDAQKAVQQVRSMLNITGTDVLDPNPGTLFQTRQAIDGMITKEANPKAVAALTDVRGQVDKMLKFAVPGIKDVDAQFAELARQREALQRGQTLLGEGRSVPRPAELASEAAEGALPSGTMVGPSGVTARLRQGTRAEIDRILGNNANDVARLNTLIKSEGDWNRARLAELFGPEKANELFRALDNEVAFAKTRNDVMGNSFTAGRQTAIAELGGRVEDDLVRNAFGADGLKGVARAGAVKTADKIAEKIMGPYREAQRASFGEAITSSRAQLVDALSRAQRSGGQQKMIEAITKAILLGNSRDIGDAASSIVSRR